MRKAGVLALGLLLVPCPSSAADAPAWKFDNPFCQVLAALVPASDRAGSEYGLQLYADHGTRVDAHVTLIAADGAYDAHVNDTNLAGAANDRRTEAALVKFATPTPVHYFFVDTFAIDGGAPVTCPSYVFPAGAGPSEDPIGGFGLVTVTPEFLQKLPDLPCGKAYIEPSVQKGFDPLVGHYGNSKRETAMHVFVDSNGNEIRATLDSSSGVQGLDDAALAGVQFTKYHPARFLCTPVVGEVEMTMEYDP